MPQFLLRAIHFTSMCFSLLSVAAEPLPNCTLTALPKNELGEVSYRLTSLASDSNACQWTSLLDLKLVAGATSYLFDGKGATIMIDLSSPKSTAFLITVSKLRFKNVTFNVKGVFSNGLVRVLGSLITFQNVIFSRVGSERLQSAIWVGDGVHDLRIQNSKFEGMWQGGVQVSSLGVHDITLIGNQFIGVLIGFLSNVKAKDLYKVTLMNNSFTEVRDSALQFNHPVNNFELNDQQWSRLRAKYGTPLDLKCCENPKAPCMTVAGITKEIDPVDLWQLPSCDRAKTPQDIYISGNLISLAATPPIDDPKNGHCIAVAGARDVRIVGNELHRCIYNGIHLEDQAGQIKITNNTISNTPGYADYYPRNTSSIWQMDTRNVLVQNNILGSAKHCGVKMYRSCGSMLFYNTFLFPDTETYQQTCFDEKFQKNLYVDSLEHETPQWTLRCKD